MLELQRQATVDKVERFVDTLPSAMTKGFGGLLAGLDASAFLHERRSFVRLSPAKRLAILERWRQADPLRRLMLRALITPLSRIVPGNFYVTIPGSAEVTRKGVAEMAEAVTAGRPDQAEQACWKFIDAIGELVAQRFR